MRAAVEEIVYPDFTAEVTKSLAYAVVTCEIKIILKLF